VTNAPSPINLDKIIHERGRLAIMSALAAQPSMTFNELKDTLGMTDGNLSVHARHLEQAGYVRIEKRFVGVKPQTSFSLTDAGQKAFKTYIDQLEQIIRQGRKGRTAE